VNAFSNFSVDKAKQFVPCPGGYVIAMSSCFTSRRRSSTWSVARRVSPVPYVEAVRSGYAPDSSRSARR